MESQARASKLGVDPSAIARDYVLNHLLAAIAEAQSPVFYFRGGTALARVYWPDYRLSEDLDFLTTAKHDRVADVLLEGVSTASERTGMALQLEFNPPTGGYARSTVRWSEGELIVDVNSGETARMPTDARRLDLPYSDLREKERLIPTVSLEEILGNKWYMLDDRKEPRDLYDIWAALCVFDVRYESVAEGYLAKYSTRPRRWRLERAKELKAGWETRLAHQLRDLPDFDEAWDCVAESFDRWEAAQVTDKSER
jgi:predicted nucleotidyltransferase component of viral defense system